MREPIEQKEEIPCCSTSRYASRQQKLGPAPFASFEDLSDEAYQSVHLDSSKTQQRMPEIQEDEVKSPEIESNLLESGRCSIVGTSTPFCPPSGPTSGLQTPSTPRIDISCASSGTPQSESSSEKELFQCSLGLAFHEDGTEDLRSSTEELDLGPEECEKSKKDKEEDKEESIRRASHPANLFHQGKISVSPDLDEQVRKLSTHSMCLDGFHSRSTRHSSFGSVECPRPGAHSSLSAHSNVSGRRSSSPHKMLYETSFCGNKPIPTPSMDLSDSPPPPKEETTNNIIPIIQTESSRGCNKLKQDSDSSLSQTLETLTETTIQVHQFTPKTRTSRGGSPPDSPPHPSTLPSQIQSTNTNTSTTTTSTKSAPIEIVSSKSNNSSNIVTASETYAQTQESSSSAKAINFNKSSSSVESDTGKQIIHLHRSTSTNDLNDEGISRSEQMTGISNRAGIDADAPIETKGLFLQESQDQEDDDELPYVPTTLPMEKSAVVSMVPVKQRRFDFSMTTNPIQRPRCNNPPNLASINDYIVHTTVRPDVNCEDKKMKINLPREDSSSEIPVIKPKSPKKKGPTSWTDFAEMGLRSPREIRRKMKEENGATRDLCSYQSDPSEGSMSANNWSDGDTDSLQTA